MRLKFKKRLLVLLCIAGGLATFSAYYIRTHPLVFNESFVGHAHCWRMAGGYLKQYAHENDGRFPFHTNGYGDAVLLIPDVWLGCFSAPDYDTKAWEEAQRTGGDVPEDQCGRVYVQGLSVTNDPDIILLFDKTPNPGDHRHFFRRIGAPLVREVVKIGDAEIIPESEWPAIAKKQIELLVAAGIAREEAEMYYSENRKK
jgi:hypothetical protein